ncbi:hypothetical protein protein [Bacillus cereus G9241]|nr:hypothetical protein protein [Bacillus cereus G9241]
MKNDFYKSIVLITLAGLPPTTTLLGTSFVTTAPEAITALSPIETPGLIIAPPPTQTLLPIFTGFPYSLPEFRSTGCKGCVAV